jgi:hypothetical protein
MQGERRSKGSMGIPYKVILQTIDVVANVLSAIADVLNGRRKHDGNRSGEKK